MSSFSIPQSGTASSRMSSRLGSQPPPSGQQAQQGLPPTGIQQQAASLNQLYAGAGYNVQQQQFGQSQAMLGGGGLPQFGGGGQQQEPMGGSLDALSRRLAQSYGLPIGKGRLVDDQGNFLYTPEQLAQASGGALTMGQSAERMNYIAQALQRQKQEEQQKKSVSALQTGLGQVQSRGRGSLAGMMSGYYTGLSDLYQSQQYEAYDFSATIQREQQQIAMEMQRRQERAARRGARGRFFAGIAGGIAGLLIPGGQGLAAQGFGTALGSAGETGWF